MSQTHEAKLLTPTEVAAILRINRDTLYSYVRTGKIKAIKISQRAMRIRAEEVERFLSHAGSEESLARIMREGK